MVELVGSYPGGQFGAQIASADFNNDGLDDLLVSAPFVSYSGRQWTGMVKLIFGRSETVQASEDYFDIAFFGESAGDQLGTSLAAGDYNNDGFTDFAMGAFRASFAGEPNGRAYIMNGRPWEAFKQLPAEYDLSLQRADHSFNGARGGEGFGFSMSVGDINRDNMDDLLIGAPFTDTSNFEKAGSVYAYFGSKSGISSDQNVLFRGHRTGERFGAAIAVAELSGDGENDVLIGAYSANSEAINQAGKVYFYDGADFFPRLVDREDAVIKGQTEKQWFGFSMNSGDINGDGVDDAAISSFPYLGQRSDAKVEIFFGGGKFVPFQKSKIAPDVVIKDPLDEALLGASVLVDDLNKDGRRDVVIGAPGIAGVMSTMPGDVYVVYGDVMGLENEFSVRSRRVHSMIHGENPDDWFGYSTAVMDYNGDGLKDLVVGSRYSEGDLSVNNGKVFILPGSDGKIFGRERPVMEAGEAAVTRGEIVSIVLDSFELRREKADALKQCNDFMDFCLFNFMAMSSFDGINLLAPITLYPDVQPDTRYYDAINTATLLGIVNGYMDDQDSPFRPEGLVTRIQALKIILAATELVPAKYRFELLAQLGSEENLTGQTSYFVDVDSKIAYMWWYPRYVNFAVENGIIEEGEFFRPNDPITAGELTGIIETTLKFLKSRDEEVES